MPRLAALILFVLAMLLPGCGGAGESTPMAGVPQPPGATLRLSSTLERTVAAPITHFRVTGLGADGTVLYGPETRPKASTVDFQPVPVEVTRVKVEYLRNSQVVGVGARNVALTAGRIVVVSDLRYVDLTQAITAVEIQPGLASVPVGAQQPFTATAVFADGSRQDVTLLADWTSAAPSVATVGHGTGLALVGSAGQANISATFQGASNVVPLTGIDSPLQAVLVTSPTSTLAVGGTTQARILGIFTAGSYPVPGVFGTSNEQIVTVSPSGLATAVSPGSASVTGSFQGLTGSAPLSIVTLSGLSISPGSSLVAPGGTVRLRALGTLGGQAVDLTDTVTWTSSSSEVTMSDLTPGEASVSLSATPGTTSTVQASYAGTVASLSLEVAAGRFVYVANGASNTNGPVFNTISQFAVQPSGTLAPIGTPVAVGSTLGNLYVHPSGRYLYACISGVAAVNAYAIGQDGTLSLLQSLPVGSSPSTPVGAAGGSLLVVSDFDASALFSFKVGDDGRLTMANQVSVSWPSSVAVDPESGYVVASSFQDNLVASYALSLDGAFTLLNTLPCGSQPTEIVVGAGGAVFVATSENLSCYSLLESGLLLSQAQANVAGAPVGLAFEPLRNLLYVFGASAQFFSPVFVTPEQLQLASVGPTLGGAAFVADDTGRFAYSANAAGQVQAFSVSLSGALQLLQTTTAQGECQDVVLTP